MIYTDETWDAGELVLTTVYDSVAHTVTETPPGTTRPMTPEEVASIDARDAYGVSVANTTEMKEEQDEGVDKLIAVIDALNALTALTNAQINQNPAAVIKDLARQCKTIARVANREARITSGRTESTHTGEEIDT